MFASNKSIDPHRKINTMDLKLCQIVQRPIILCSVFVIFFIICIPQVALVSGLQEKYKDKPCTRKSNNNNQPHTSAVKRVARRDIIQQVQELSLENNHLGDRSNQYDQHEKIGISSRIRQKDKYGNTLCVLPLPKIWERLRRREIGIRERQRREGISDREILMSVTDLSPGSNNNTSYVRDGTESSHEVCLLDVIMDQSFINEVGGFSEARFYVLEALYITNKIFKSISFAPLMTVPNIQSYYKNSTFGIAYGEPRVIPDFSDDMDMAAVLDEIARLGNAFADPYCSRILFSGRIYSDAQNSGYNQVGLAYVESACTSRYNAAVVAYTHRDLLSLITAHEIGHQFGSIHDELHGDPECASPPDHIYIMYPLVSHPDIKNNFSLCSIQDMALFFQDQICFVPLSSLLDNIHSHLTLITQAPQPTPENMYTQTIALGTTAALTAIVTMSIAISLITPHHVHYKNI